MTTTRTVHVSGASDDLVDFTGAIHDEFYNYGRYPGEGEFEFNDGTVLRVHLDDSDGDGIWRVELLSSGGPNSTIVLYRAPVAGLDRDFTDLAVVSGDFTAVTARNDGGRGPRTVYVPGFEPDGADL